MGSKLKFIKLPTSSGNELAIRGIQVQYLEIWSVASYILLVFVPHFIVFLVLPSRMRCFQKDEPRCHFFMVSVQFEVQR
ncbi:hypothetical protein HYALB_00007731 [Hymenoscyphus albidus]|uniref:Uncharacterized protein n=1 Tax=Hymenoscyphus albidus TaxID=595503 RepID=A0A9N9LHQ0_9HELO|nr:hypothetical protein HYALB_00007731 [Hymenoscyphus albidus]